MKLNESKNDFWQCNNLTARARKIIVTNSRSYNYIYIGVQYSSGMENELQRWCLVRLRPQGLDIFWVGGWWATEWPFEGRMRGGLRGPLWKGGKGEGRGLVEGAAETVDVGFVVGRLVAGESCDREKREGWGWWRRGRWSVRWKKCYVKE